MRLTVRSFKRENRKVSIILSYSRVLTEQWRYNLLPVLNLIYSSERSIIDCWAVWQSSFRSGLLAKSTDHAVSQYVFQVQGNYTLIFQTLNYFFGFNHANLRFKLIGGTQLNIWHALLKRLKRLMLKVLGDRSMFMFFFSTVNMPGFPFNLKSMLW